MEIPEGLGWVRRLSAGRDWLAELPRRLDECVQRWSLRLGPPFPAAHASLALPAELPDGTAAVLKLQYPDRESRHEGDALARWAGDGAVRLLAHDPRRRALLVERCRPGAPLHTLPADRALDAVTGLLPRLWRPAGAPFTPLAEEAAGWAERMPDAWERAGRPYERRLLDAALGQRAELAPGQGEQVDDRPDPGLERRRGWRLPPPDRGGPLAARRGLSGCRVPGRPARGQPRWQVRHQ